MGFPEVGMRYLLGSKFIYKGDNIYHWSCRFMWEEQTFLIREL